jgi:hypothetical protein
MITYYLRFPSQDDWEQAAAAIGLRVNNPILIEEEKIDPDTGEIIPPVYEDNWSWLPMYTHQWGVDEIGIICNDDGVYDPETGEELVPPTPMDGWHVNCISETLPEELEDYLVRPSSPVRIFAA